MTGERSVAVHVTGRVQGVGFRVWVRREAGALGLSGWVRNERDGSVRALLAGSRQAVDEMLTRLRQGPSGAVVEGVAVEESGTLPPSGFRITG